MFFINVHELKLKILILFVALINDSDVFLMGCSSMELSSWKGRPLLYLSDPRTCRFSGSPGHWQFYDTSQEKNVIWTERQLLLVQHIGFLHWCHTLCNCVLKCAKLCKILQNFAQLHCLCISAEPMGSLKKPKGGIANDNSIGSLVFCPLDASS